MNTIRRGSGVQHSPRGYHPYFRRFSRLEDSTSHSESPAASVRGSPLVGGLPTPRKQLHRQWQRTPRETQSDGTRHWTCLGAGRRCVLMDDCYPPSVDAKTRQQVFKARRAWLLGINGDYPHCIFLGWPRSPTTHDWSRGDPPEANALGVASLRGRYATDGGLCELARNRPDWWW